MGPISEMEMVRISLSCQLTFFSPSSFTRWIATLGSFRAMKNFKRLKEKCKQSGDKSSQSLHPNVEKDLKARSDVLSKELIILKII